MMIGVSNHLLTIVFRFHYHSQEVIGSLGYSGKYPAVFAFPPWAQVSGPVIIPGTDHFRMLPMLGRHQRGKTRSREDRRFVSAVCGSNHTSG